jgi:hypothetical protein
MGIPNVRLEPVRRKSGGRIHLTPRVPDRGPVTTLCGQTLPAGSYSASESDADCANCIRRSRDPSRISSAFFESEEGSQLLRLSLEQARLRRPEPAQRPQRTAGGPPPLRVMPPPPPVPDRAGELVTSGFKAAGEGVWRSPAGVVVRLRRDRGEWRFAELVFEGTVLATREGAGLRLRAGDVEVRPAGDGLEVRIKR